MLVRNWGALMTALKDDDGVEAYAAQIDQMIRQANGVEWLDVLLLHQKMRIELRIGRYEAAITTFATLAQHPEVIPAMLQTLSIEDTEDVDYIDWENIAEGPGVAVENAISQNSAGVGVDAQIVFGSVSARNPWEPDPNKARELTTRVLPSPVQAAATGSPQVFSAAYQALASKDTPLSQAEAACLALLEDNTDEAAPFPPRLYMAGRCYQELAAQDGITSEEKRQYLLWASVYHARMLVHYGQGNRIHELTMYCRLELASVLLELGDRIKAEEFLAAAVELGGEFERAGTYKNRYQQIQAAFDAQP